MVSAGAGMEKLLKYKDENVCVFNMTPSGMILSVPKVITPELLPIGVMADTPDHLQDFMSDWWRSNMIPVERDSIRLGLECIGVRSEEELKLLSHGLSLVNHYWLCDPEEQMKWSDINFWDNGFSDEVGLALFNHRPLRQGILCSPDTSLNGQLKKKWISKDGKFYLVKSGSSYLGQEVFNEKLASDLYEAAGTLHVKYEIAREKEPVSVCRCMTDRDHELIPVSQIFNSIERIPYQTETELHYFYRLLDHYEVKYSKKQINDMLCIDYIMAGTDRHYSNIGILSNRESGTLELAPIYDSGTSMWSGSRMTDMDIYDDTIMARPFCNKNTFGTWKEQVNYITEYPDLMPEEISRAALDYVKSMLKESDIPAKRVAILGSAVLKRAGRLQEHLAERKIDVAQENKITKEQISELDAAVKREAVLAQKQQNMEIL